MAGHGGQTYGGTKVTFPHRYADQDEALCRLLAERNDANGRIRVHDVAASNAITSVELFERLQGFTGLTLVASDFFDAITVVTPPDSKYSAVFDRGGSCIQVVGNGRVFVPGKKFRLSKAAEIARSFFVRRYVEWIVSKNHDSSKVEEIGLWHPKAVALAGNDKRFVLRREDIFDLQPGPYDVIRVMGTLSFFPDGVIPTILESLFSRVTDGGLVVLADSGKTTDRGTNGSIFERCGKRTKSILDVNRGFSLKSNVEQVRLP